MIELNEVVYHWQKGQNITQIARSLGISRPTVRKYLKAAKAAGLTREAGETSSAIPENVMAAMAEAAKPAPFAAGGVQEIIALHKEQISAWLDEPDMTAKQVCRLLAEQGYPFNYSSLKRYVRKLKPDNSQRVTVRLETATGDQAQVDFGQVTLSLGDKKKRVWAFVMALSYSRHRFVRFVERQDTNTWLDCHIRAFEFFGGCPRTVLLDNLKAGVVKADLYDPTINRAYAELERHYGFVADPAKVRTPEHKGKVERSMPTVRQQLAAGRQYKDLAEANEKALTWLLTGIGQEKHGTTHEEPVLRFERDEKNALIHLPSSRFEIPHWKECTVHPDHHVVFDKSYYSVPTRYVGKKVWVRGTFRLTEIFLDRELIKCHVRAHKPGTWRTDENDYPDKAKAFLFAHPTWCRQQAETFGEDVARMVKEILEPHSLQNLRKAQAVLRFADKHGAAKLNDACRHLLSFGSTSRHSLQRVLENGIPKKQELPTIPTISAEGEQCLHPATSFGEVAA
jgi:transposase